MTAQSASAEALTGYRIYELPLHTVVIDSIAFSNRTRGGRDELSLKCNKEVVYLPNDWSSSCRHTAVIAATLNIVYIWYGHARCMTLPRFTHITQCYRTYSTCRCCCCWWWWWCICSRHAPVTSDDTPRPRPESISTIHCGDDDETCNLILYIHGGEATIRLFTPTSPLAVAFSTGSESK